MATVNDKDGLECFLDYIDGLKTGLHFNEKINIPENVMYHIFFSGIAHGLNLGDYISGDCLDLCTAELDIIYPISK